MTRRQKLTSKCCLGVLTNQENKAAFMMLAPGGGGQFTLTWVNSHPVQNRVTPSKLRWGSAPWHPRSSGSVPSGTNPGLRHAGAGAGPCLCQGSVLFLNTGGRDSSVHPWLRGQAGYGWWGAHAWRSPMVHAWRLCPTAGRGKVVLEDVLVADVKIPSGSLISLDWFKDIEAGGTSMPSSTPQGTCEGCGGFFSLWVAYWAVFLGSY